MVLVVAYCVDACIKPFLVLLLLVTLFLCACVSATKAGIAASTKQRTFILDRVFKVHGDFDLHDSKLAHVLSRIDGTLQQSISAVASLNLMVYILALRS